MEKKIESWPGRHPVAMVFFLIIAIVLFISLLSGNNQTANAPVANNSVLPVPGACPSDTTTLENTAGTIKYAELIKDPGSFTNQPAVFTGQVVQIQESDGQGYMRLAVTPTSYGWDPTDIIYVSYQGHTDAVENDVVTVYGINTGSYTYKSEANYEITIPGMNGCLITKGYPKSQTSSAVQNAQPASESVPVVVSAPPQKSASANDLSVSCSPSVTSTSPNQNVTWTATATGGTGKYTYSWSGTDNVTWNNNPLNTTYFNTGTKNASVQVTSGDQSVTQSCGSITVANPKSWHTVATFSGSDNKTNTDPFTIQGSQWKIVWSASADSGTDNYCQTYGCDFSAQIFDTTDNLQQDYILKDNITSLANDTSNYYTPGTYYLTINGTSMSSWTISVEDYY